MIKRLSILTVLLLLLSLTPLFLRGNTFDPYHPKVIAGNCGQEIARCEDKSWLAIFFGLSILGLRLLNKLKNAETHLLKFVPARISASFYFPQLFDPLQIGFRRGIIHPQIYA